jgi:hypothetical protein
MYREWDQLEPFQIHLIKMLDDEKSDNVQKNKIIDYEDIQNVLLCKKLICDILKQLYLMENEFRVNSFLLKNKDWLNGKNMMVGQEPVDLGD